MRTTAPFLVVHSVACLLFSGCMRQEEDPCRYEGLPEGRAPASDTMIVRAILDSNGLDTIRATGVAWRNGQLDFGYLNLDSLYFPAIAAQLRSIREINFQYNRLTQVPRGISHFRSVTHLYFWDNWIDTLSDELFTLTQLKSLSLSYNLLISLPPGIANLRSLTSLDLSRNSLFSLPSEITGLSAALGRCDRPSIEVSGNYLCALPATVTAFLDRLSYKGWRQTQVCPLP